MSKIDLTTWCKRWDRTIKFRELLSGDDSDEESRRIGRIISERINKTIPETDRVRDDDLTDIIENLEDVQCRDDLNACLGDLYDWGDEGKRLFVEL